jgi:hypothetical protein
VLDVWETDAGDRDPLLLDWMQGWAMSLLEENYNAANISQLLTSTNAANLPAGHPGKHLLSD